MLVCVTSLDESESSDSDIPSSVDSNLNGITPRRTQLRIGKLKEEMQHMLRRSGFDGSPDDPTVNSLPCSQDITDSDSCYGDDSTTTSIQISMASKQDVENSSSALDDNSIQDIWRVFNDKSSVDVIDRLGTCLKMIRKELAQVREHDQGLIRQFLSAHRTMNNIVCNQYSDMWDLDDVFVVDDVISDDSLLDIKEVVSKIPPLRRRRRSAPSPDYDEEGEEGEQEVYDPLSMSSPLFLASSYNWKTHQVTLL